MILLGEEINNCLRKANNSSQLCLAFEGGQRQKLLQQGHKIQEDYISNVCRLLKFSAGLSVSLAFCLSKSQVRSFVAESYRILKARIPELVQSGSYLEISEDILIGLVQLIRTSEVHSNDCFLSQHLLYFYVILRNCLYLRFLEVF